MRKIRLDRAHLKIAMPERHAEPLQARPSQPSRLEPQKLCVRASRLRVREAGER
jgi:hypothetical protein